MTQKLYIRVKDEGGNWNIWCILCEIKIRGRTGYLIRSRSTYACILTEHCMCEYGSTLLYYDKNTIDIGKCKAEYESKKEYSKWKAKQSENINPFSILDEVDFGYLEDIDRSDWYL